MKKVIPVYVINLDRSAERLRRITAELQAAGLTFQRVQAVEAASLPPDVPEYDHMANGARYLAPLSRGEIACVLSHREVWRLMAAQPEQSAAVVLEDDARLAGNIRDLADAVEGLARSPHPELVKLYDLNPPRPQNVTYRRRRPLLPALTTTAQALNRAAATNLLRFTEQFHEPADVIIQRWWDHGVNVTTLVPPIFSEVGHGEESTIRARGQRPAEGRLRRELRRPVWQLRRLAAAMAARTAEKLFTY